MKKISKITALLASAACAIVMAGCSDPASVVKSEKADEISAEQVTAASSSKIEVTTNAEGVKCVKVGDSDEFIPVVTPEYFTEEKVEAAKQEIMSEAQTVLAQVQTMMSSITATQSNTTSNSSRSISVEGISTLFDEFNTELKAFSESLTSGSQNIAEGFTAAFNFSKNPGDIDFTGIEEAAGIKASVPTFDINFSISGKMAGTDAASFAMAYSGNVDSHVKASASVDLVTMGLDSELLGAAASVAANLTGNVVTSTPIGLETTGTVTVSSEGTTDVSGGTSFEEMLAGTSVAGAVAGDVSANFGVTFAGDTAGIIIVKFNAKIASADLKQAATDLAPMIQTVTALTSSTSTTTGTTASLSDFSSVLTEENMALIEKYLSVSVSADICDFDGVSVYTIFKADTTAEFIAAVSEIANSVTETPAVTGSVE